jgi:phosphatidylglycerol---prolipoprotein diacylglyceryl transferase
MTRGGSCCKPSVLPRLPDQRSVLRLRLDCWYHPYMLPQLGQLGPITLRTYTLLLDLAILIGLAVLTWRGWNLDDEPVRWLDTGLWGLAGGIIGGRLTHVAIHWQYFSEYPADIPAIWQGGIDWHGAVLVGLVCLLIVCRRQGINFRSFGVALAYVLPIGAILADAGCLASGCGHGREVASLAGYPAYIAAELPDLYGIVAPRFQTQLFGIFLNFSLLIGAFAASRGPRLAPLTFWVILVLSGVGTFALDFTRGDSVPMLGSLRLDQILDLVVALAGVAGLVGGRWISRTALTMSKTSHYQA